MNDVWKELCENIAGKLRVEHERIESLPDKEKIVDNFLRSQQDEIVECFISLWDEYLDQVAPIVSIDAEASEDESESVEADNPPEEANSQSNPAPEAAPEVNPKHDEPERPQKTIPVLYEYYPEPPPWPKPKPDPSPSAEQQSSSTPPILPMPLLTGKLMLRDKQIIFPNGRVNQQYVVDCLSIRRQTDIYDIYFEGLEQIGLRYDRKSSHIIGTPHEAGDFPVKMFYRKPNQQKYSSHNMILIINHDPRSLWKPIPTSPSIEYYKEDSAMQFVLVDDGPIAKKDMVGASRRGRSHAQEGKARDDDFALDFEDGWYIMVVADGAGSAPYSRKGSEMACRIIVEESKRQLGLKQEQFKDLIGSYHSNPSKESNKAAGDVLYTILGAAAFKAVSAIKHEAESKGRAVKDYATTLLAAICRKFSFGWFVGSFWVGDGGMGIYSRDTSYLKVLGEPDGGEFAGQTRFLTMPGIVDNPTELYNRLRIDIVPDFTALILMTDGVTDPKFETDANLKRIEKWHALWDDLHGKNEDGVRVELTDNNKNSAPQLLNWLDFWSRGNHDDRTIAIMY